MKPKILFWIFNNTIFINDRSGGYSSYAIQAFGGNHDERNSIYNNHITAIGQTHGIWADYADIYDNYLTTGEEFDHHEWVIGHGDYNHIYNNKKSDDMHTRSRGVLHTTW